MKELLEIFLIFFKLGLFTFGGGYAMIPLIKEQIVDNKKWLTDKEMLEIIAVAESTPGPLAINTATYVGYKRKKVLGSIFATLGVVIPSLVIIFIISLFFNKFIESKYVSYAFVGIKCCVGFLIIKAGINLLKKLDKKVITFIIFALTCITSLLLEVFDGSFSSIFMIIIGGTIGLISNAFEERKEKDK